MKTKRAYEGIIKKVLGKYRPISVYIYGSCLREDFNPDKSDIDIFIVLKNSSATSPIIQRIKRDVKKIPFRLDLNVCFEDEFEYRVHVDRPITYYIGIKKQSKLIMGKDVLKGLSEKELDPLDIYKRAISLSQRLRHSYLNDVDVDFWTRKSRKWIQTLVLEIMYLDGTFCLEYRKGIQQFAEKHPLASRLLSEKYEMNDGILLLDVLRRHLKSRFGFD